MIPYIVGVLLFVLLVVVAGWCAWFVLLPGCRRSMELEGLSCHARCNGDLGDGGRMRCCHCGLRYLSPWQMSVRR
jgi:hypothetical protein